MNGMRSNERAMHQLRDIQITPHIFEYAAGSLLFELGKTKILCSVTLQHGVPPFLKGQNTGWLSAEYALLPAATQVRTPRESTQNKKNGRAVEISRLIGRTLRTVVNLDVLGERTIHVDCDVLQADGGTRTASITAAGLALSYAQQQWLADGIITAPILRDIILAVSIGHIDNRLVADPDYHEDCTGIADFNFVMTQRGHLIEVQGGAEKHPLDWEIFTQAGALAQSATQTLFQKLLSFAPHLATIPLATFSPESKKESKKEYKGGIFTLSNRINTR